MRSLDSPGSGVFILTGSWRRVPPTGDGETFRPRPLPDCGSTEADATAPAPAPGAGSCRRMRIVSVTPRAK